MKNISELDKIYVLSVKSFSDRISHIKKQFEKHNINFEFIFEYDADEITGQSEAEAIFNQSSLTKSHKSLILKHVQAWKNCIKNGYKNILVLEDDVVLRENFSAIISKALFRAKMLMPGYLIFLSGRDTKVPFEFLLSNDILFKNSISTADGYITDSKACENRLIWLESNLVDLPADHLIKKIDLEFFNTQYWTTTPAVEQGSVFGLFNSTLDKKRMHKSRIHNFLRYHIKIFTRRTFIKIVNFFLLRRIK